VPAQRDRLLTRLATAGRPRLVAVARRAGAGADAEDAVQDVLARLAAGGELPPDEARATAYATTAVRHRALDLARRATAAPEADPATAPEPADAHERRRALRAFAQAVGPLPERARAVLVLDAAGWSRAEVARHLGTTERVVKRLLDRHRADAVAAAAAAVGGEDCARLAATLASFAGGAGRPRADGPAARHLEVCDACRLALVRARAVRALLPPPPAIGVPVPATPAPPAAPLAALKVGAAVVAAVTAAGGAGLVVRPSATAHTLPPAVGLIAPPPSRAPHAAPPPARPATQQTITVRVATRPRRTRSPRHHAPRHVTVAPRAVHHAAAPRAAPRHRGCELGTLGICGL
jgi:RNA polymerase sigma factor (sigma-70 family)